MKSSKGSAMAGAAKSTPTISHFIFSRTKLRFTRVQMDKHPLNEVQNNAVLHKEAQTQSFVSIGRIVLAVECHS